jgi:hypothetical protein
MGTDAAVAPSRQPVNSEPNLLVNEPHCYYLGTKRWKIGVTDTIDFIGREMALLKVTDTVDLIT